MTEDQTELRQRVDRLERRVGELERLLDEQDTNHATDEKDGLDSRDAAVVGALEHGETYTVRDLKSAYLEHTDVRRKKTAKRRVKQLTKRDFFQANGRRWTYRG